MEGKPKQIFINNIKYDVIQRSSERDDPKSIDFGVKNKWNWNWLTEKDFSDQEDFLSNYIVKISNLALHIVFIVMLTLFMVALVSEI